VILATVLSSGECQITPKKPIIDSSYNADYIKDDDYKKILKKVIEIVVDKLGVGVDEVKPEAKLKEDLGADSLDTVELIMEFEKVFNIPISDEIAENVKTIHDAVLAIQKVKKEEAK